MANVVVGAEIQVNSSKAQNSVKELKEQLKEAQSEVKKISKEFGESSIEAINASKRVEELKNKLNVAQESVKTLKQKFKEAQAEVIAMSEKFGETSEQAVNAAQKAAELKDAIGDAKQLTDAFDPGRKFQAFSVALKGVVGGFEALKGAQALFGTESEALEKTLAKVQGAMAFSQGINEVLEMGKSFKLLKAVLTEIPIVQKAITAAQWLWNAAMDANPIGAIIIAVTALIAGITMLVSWLRSSSDAAEEQAAAIKKSSDAIANQKRAMDESNEALDRNQKQQLAMAKATGKSTDEIRKLERSLMNKKIADLEGKAAAALHTVELEKQALATLRAAGANDENIKAQEENLKAARENLKAANDNITKAGKERIDLINRQNVEIAQEQTDANKKSLEQQKAHNDKIKEEQKKNAEDIKNANKKANEDILKVEQDITLLRIADERKRAELKLEMDLEAAKKDVENTKANAELKAKLIADLETKYMLDLKALQDKAAEEDKKKEQEKSNERLEALKQINQTRIDAISNSYLKAQELEALRYQDEIDKNLELLNQKKISQEEYNAWRENADKIHTTNLQQINKDNTEAQKKIDEERFNNQQELAQKTAGILEQFANVVGKQTAAGKALAIAAATIDTYQGAMKAFKATYSPIGPVDVAMRFASVAATIATGIKNVKAIAAVQIPGGGGGGGVPSGMSSAAPITPQVATTTLNQGQVNQMANASARAYVVESDVSGNQERIERLNRAARIN